MVIQLHHFLNAFFCCFQRLVWQVLELLQLSSPAEAIFWRKGRLLRSLTQAYIINIDSERIRHIRLEIQLIDISRITQGT